MYSELYPAYIPTLVNWFNAILSLDFNSVSTNAVLKNPLKPLISVSGDTPVEEVPSLSLIVEYLNNLLIKAS